MAHEVNRSEKDIAEYLRSALVSRIGSERMDLWIPPETVWSYHNGQLRLEFENSFSCELAQKMLASEIAGHLRELDGETTKLVFEVSAFPNTSSPSSSLSKPAAAADLNSAENDPPKRSNRPAVWQPEPRHPKSISGGIPRNESPANSLIAEGSWNRFVEGKSNQLAYVASKMVVAQQGGMTPLFLHGPSGVGKSLLVAGIAEQLRTVQRLRRVTLMTSEQFLNDFTDGLRRGGLPMFRRKYRGVEALILEDIQFFAGKKSSLTEVKNTLDNLLRAGKQVIFTADRSLNDLRPLGAELIARLQSGLSAQIFPLDNATRSTVLRRFLNSEKVEIADDLVSKIAERVTGDGRILSGISKRLAATQFFSAGQLNWDQCWNAISDLVQATQPVVRIVDIDRVVCDVFGLDPESLRSKTKMRRVSRPRMLAMFLARKYTPAAYQEIGQYFGSRRHSTVISAEKTVETWLGENANLDAGRGLTVRDAIRHVESQLQVG
ncbi:MAG: DnaA ATPase domain-containing protein [Aureliella sp.]